ncbi:MAG: DsbC family protein [Thermodesulfobacteriota bacterium]|nr:DsbC family protein [Thermodesulfobacteriota bacterium]
MPILSYLTLLLTPIFFLVQAQDCLAAACPSKETTQQKVVETFKKNINVIKIQPSAVPGLCEVQINFKSQNRILYTDQKGKFLITGVIFRNSDGTNITKEAIDELNRFSDSDIKRLEDLTAFTVGSKGEIVYFVTDPQCPYCHKAEEIVTQMAEAGELQLKILLFPLGFHKGAKEQCISVICDNKGLEGLHSQYKSENQCQEGKTKIEDTLRFLRQKGITGVPTYIFKDRKYHSGVLKEQDMRKRLGLKDETAPPAHSIDGS